MHTIGFDSHARWDAPHATAGPLGRSSAPPASGLASPSPRLPPQPLPYETWFRVADENGDGKINGPECVKFFERSGLARDVLAQAREKELAAAVSPPPARTC